MRILVEFLFVVQKWENFGNKFYVFYLVRECTKYRLLFEMGGLPNYVLTLSEQQNRVGRFGGRHIFLCGRNY